MMQLTVSEISKRLAERAEDVCVALLPGGKRRNGTWEAGDVSGAPGDSLKVHLTGSHAGNWKDWADDSLRGDLVDLFRLSRNLAPGDAVKAAKQFLGIYEAPPSKPYKKSPEKPWVSPIDEGGRAWKWLTEERKIQPAIIHQYRVHCDNQKNAIVFPSYSIGGELLNRSYRTLEKKVWQDKECAPCLFGWHAMPAHVFESRACMISEGQLDAMTWAQWGIPCLSVPNGAGMSWIEFEWDNLGAFDRIYLAYDNDEEGKKFAKQAAERIGPHRCFFVSTPFKDANDALKAGKTQDDAFAWLRAAKPVPVNGLILGSDDSTIDRVRDFMRPKPRPFTIYFLGGPTPDQGFYFRDAEVTLWSGASGHGKSTMLATVMLNLISEKIPFFVCSLEYKVEKLCQTLAQIVCQRTASQDDVEKFLRMFGNLFTFADVVGEIAPAKLIELMNAAHSRYGAKHFFIDSLMRVSGLEEDYPKQGQFVNELQGIAKKTSGHIHLVAHPRKHDENLRSRKMDVKGSSMLVNNADNVVTMHRNQEKRELRDKGELTPEMDAGMHDSEFAVEKQRETGWEGVIKLKLNPLTKVFEPFYPKDKAPAMREDPRKRRDAE